MFPRPEKNTPLLILCEMGLVRSVAFKVELCLNRDYINVLNAGIDTVDPQTLDMLFNWAERVYVTADDSVWNRIPWDMRGKCIYVNIGTDHWHDPSAGSLKRLMYEEANKLNL